jgi:hypothetical protein
MASIVGRIVEQQEEDAANNDKGANGPHYHSHSGQLLVFLEVDSANGRAQQGQ